MRRLSKLIPISSPSIVLKGMSSITELEITLPDDFHHHLRDGDVLENIVHHASRSFGRVVVMPNIKPPVRTLDEVRSSSSSSSSSSYTHITV
jgi:hypothetical protein